MPSSAEARMDASSWACSSGHIRSRSHSTTSMSSASPRNSVWHRCTWACTKPGTTRAARGVDDRRRPPAVARHLGDAPVHAHRPTLDHAGRSAGHDRPAGDQEIVSHRSTPALVSRSRSLASPPAPRTSPASMVATTPSSMSTRPSTMVLRTSARVGRVHELLDEVVALAGQNRPQVAGVQADHDQVGPLARPRWCRSRSPMPRAAAEPAVAMAEHLAARHDRGVLEASFCTSAAWRISSNMSRLLLVMIESVPSPTVTPAASMAGTRAVPLPSFMFEVGQWATAQPRDATSSMSASVEVDGVGDQDRGPGPISRSRYAAGRSPVRSAMMPASRGGSRPGGCAARRPRRRRSLAHRREGRRRRRSTGRGVRTRCGSGPMRPLPALHERRGSASSVSPAPGGESMTCGLMTARSPDVTATLGGLVGMAEDVDEGGGPAADHLQLVEQGRRPLVARLVGPVLGQREVLAANGRTAGPRRSPRSRHSCMWALTSPGSTDAPPGVDDRRAAPVVATARPRRCDRRGPRHHPRTIRRRRRGPTTRPPRTTRSAASGPLRSAPSVTRRRGLRPTGSADGQIGQDPPVLDGHAIRPGVDLGGHVEGEVGIDRLEQAAVLGLDGPVDGGDVRPALRGGCIVAADELEEQRGAVVDGRARLEQDVAQPVFVDEGAPEHERLDQLGVGAAGHRPRQPRRW